MDFAIHTDDFVLEHAQPSLFRSRQAELFDLVIMNPPYFKVRKDSETARAMQHVVYGQPNIYALFMAVAADLIAGGGQMVAITPRSYFNGPYFKRFRKYNVRPFTTQFRPKSGKPMHIRVTDESKRLLLPSKRYVLLKRFTAKEERRRLVAGIIEPEDSYSPLLGLENHLNYIKSNEGELPRDEAAGLAALLNSALIDRYFRAISGNPQVNAAEIRTMPMPDIEVIRQIGRAASMSGDASPLTVERIVADALGLPTKLVMALTEAVT